MEAQPASAPSILKQLKGFVQIRAELLNCVNMDSWNLVVNCWYGLDACDGCHWRFFTGSSCEECSWLWMANTPELEFDKVVKEIEVFERELKHQLHKPDCVCSKRAAVSAWAWKCGLSAFELERPHTSIRIKLYAQAPGRTGSSALRITVDSSLLPLSMEARIGVVTLASTGKACPLLLLQ
jgi:hypothetical protein